MNSKILNTDLVAQILKVNWHGQIQCGGDISPVLVSLNLMETPATAPVESAEPNCDRQNPTVQIEAINNEGVHRQVSMWLGEHFNMGIAARGIGVRLSSTAQAYGFYQKIGMKCNGNIFIFSAAEAREFALKGEL